MIQVIMLLLALLVTAGCDDPAVSDAVGSALVNGGVTAEADCVADTAGSYGSWAPGLSHYRVRVQKLIDGGLTFAASESKSAPVDQPRFWAICKRGTDCAGGEFLFANMTTLTGENDEFGQGAIAARFFIADGVFTLQYENASFSNLSQPNPLEAFSEGIDTACTGFNLEAFGVEP